VAMRHVERTALDHIAASARHFDTPVMQRLIATGQPGGHSELAKTLDSTNFIGIRLFDARKQEIETLWAQIPASLRTAISARTENRVVEERPDYDWLSIGSETVVRVVAPLGHAESPYGYLEGYYRIDRDSRRAQRRQVEAAGLIGLGSAASVALLLYPIMLRLLRRTWSLSQALLESNVELMQTLGSALAKRDSDTGAHNYRVTLYAVRVAQAMGCPRPEIADLITCAFLHDVGKIGIPDSILLKPTRLTPDEMTIMEKHVILGQEIVRDSGWLTRALPVIRYHHERFDGLGYPDGLAGEQIPFGARLFAVVDVFDALTSERPYKAAYSLEQTLQIMRPRSGRHFDPRIFDIFQTQAAELLADIGRATPEDLQRQLSVEVETYFSLKRG